MTDDPSRETVQRLVALILSVGLGSVLIYFNWDHPQFGLLFLVAVPVLVVGFLVMYIRAVMSKRE